MIWNVLLAFASLVLLCFDMATHPRTLECPRGWDAMGTSARGDTGCRMAYGCVDRRGMRGGWTSDCDGELDVYRRIYCDRGERAVVNLRGVVRCERF